MIYKNKSKKREYNIVINKAIFRSKDKTYARNILWKFKIISIVDPHEMIWDVFKGDLSAVRIENDNWTYCPRSVLRPFDISTLATNIEYVIMERAISILYAVIFWKVF